MTNRCAPSAALQTHSHGSPAKKKKTSGFWRRAMTMDKAAMKNREKNDALPTPREHSTVCGRQMDLLCGREDVATDVSQAIQESPSPVPYSPGCDRVTREALLRKKNARVRFSVVGRHPASSQVRKPLFAEQKKKKKNSKLAGKIGSEIPDPGTAQNSVVVVASPNENKLSIKNAQRRSLRVLEMVFQRRRNRRG